MQGPVSYSAVQHNPSFCEFVKRRKQFTALLSLAIVVPYCAFILVAALTPHVLVMRISEASHITIGWPIGLALIFVSWLLTGWYVLRSNGEFTQRLDAIVLELKK
ncbi:DUF485 domain-containing protein [Cupriavidus sp. RAF12]|uniref:DUF485 domain-containing protein n=1 Tax=Cupriavidus sp. RAF12 TaxID=3233050 RepID=UPI003F91836A